MSFDTEIQIGIKMPKELAVTADEMRLAIREAARDSFLIRRALDSGIYNGKSGEDTYVLLAYHALLELERQWQANNKWLNLQPSPSMIFPKDQP